MNIHTILLSQVATIIYLIFSISILASAHKNRTIGFTIDLIHGDFSPESPFFNSFLSPYERLANVLRREENHRMNKRFQESDPLPEPLVSGSGVLHIVEFAIGTPPVRTLIQIDTGSSVIWTQCLPCIKCFSQSEPKFNPINSQTYKRVWCDNVECKMYRGNFCIRNSRYCSYGIRYADGSYSVGDFATDTFVFRSSTEGKVTFPNMKFGCAHNSSGLFPGVASGVMGLGSGPTGLIQQLGLPVEGKFGYCLVPYPYSLQHKSKLTFGQNSVVGEGSDVIVIPLVKKEGSFMYRVILNDIIVGNSERRQRMSANSSYFNSFDRVNGSSSRQEVNMVIDCGSVQTYLPVDIFNNIKEEVAKTVKLKQTKDSFGKLCFLADELGDEFPDMSLRFKGANDDLILRPFQTFYEPKQSVWCLAFQPEARGYYILGSWAQNSHLVGFDLQKMTVSFKPYDCEFH